MSASTTLNSKGKTHLCSLDMPILILVSPLPDPNSSSIPCILPLSLSLLCPIIGDGAEANASTIGLRFPCASLVILLESQGDGERGESASVAPP